MYRYNVSFNLFYMG